MSVFYEVYDKCTSQREFMTLGLIQRCKKEWILQLCGSKENKKIFLAMRHK